MGSMIHLAIGRLEIDWGKNFAFHDHSALYQDTDLKQVAYNYVDEDVPQTDGEYSIIQEYKIGLSKPLNEVIDRINLLGYTPSACEKEYYYLAERVGFDTTKFSYEQLKQCLEKIDVLSLSPDYGPGGEDFGKFFRREIYPRLGLSEVVQDPHYLEYSGGELLENLTPYALMHMLSSNPQTKGLSVDWAFSDLEENGWGTRDSFVRPLDQSNRFLIVTEGSSDVKILRHAFSLLRPHIADFFDFVDMEEGYPFSGTGSLMNFVKGLISISVQNNIIVLFDNDAEGVAGYKKCSALKVLDNMRILKLPNLEEFTSFKTIGPNGEALSNINERGVAIECYLDLAKGDDPMIRWNNFNTYTSTYQGELIKKDDYKRAFLSSKMKDPIYNYSKLEKILDMIVTSCIEMKSSLTKLG